MTLIDVGIILLYLIISAAGVLILINSVRINNWVWSWSMRILKSFGEIPNPESQRRGSLWIVRLAGFLLMAIPLLGLYFLVINI